MPHLRSSLQLLSLVSVCFVVACGSDRTPTGPSSAPPQVTSLAPAAAVRGTTVAVTIAGSGFVAGETTAVTVSGDGISVSDVHVESATTATATVAVAADAAVGPRQLVVTTAAGGSSAAHTFTVVPPSPTLTSIAPTTVTAGTAQRITLTGANFVSGASTVGVSGSGVAVTDVAVQDPGSLTATLTIDAAADVGPRTVTVTTAGGTTAPQTLTINPRAPTLTRLEPATGRRGTTIMLTISGGSFVPGATTVTVSGDGVTVGSVSISGAAGGTIAAGADASGPLVAGTGTTLTVPLMIDGNATPGVRNVTVTTAGGTSAALTFTITATPPTAGTFTADPSTVTAGQAATLRWTGIDNATSCSIDGGVGTVTCANGSVSVTPNGTTTYTLTASGVGGVVTLPATVTVNESVRIGSFSASPASIVSGGTSTLSWSGIANASGCSIDNGIGNVSCSDGSMSVSPASTITYRFTATGAGGTATATASVGVNAPAPTLASVSPLIGSTLGGTAITLSGTNLTGATSVTLDGIAATAVTVVNATTVTATAPAHAAGAVNVVITTPGGSATRPNGFTYVVLPTIAGVTANSGPASGGSGITVTGTNLTGTTALTIGGVPATSVNVVNSTTVTAVTPAHAVGAVNVVITVPAGSATLTNGYTYLATSVGQPAFGGVIAALNGGLNNLIAATADNSTGIVWSGVGTATNAQSTTDGASNTATIVAMLGNNGGVPYAAQVCSNFEVDSQANTPCQAGNTCYNDWFLPAGSNLTASGQLNALFVNQAAIGGFAGAFYWSSTEYVGAPLADAFAQGFANGLEGFSGKVNALRVRCVRTFTP